MMEFLIFAAFFLSFATLGALCGTAVWLMKLEDRVTVLEDRSFCAVPDRRGRQYLWTPFGQTERDHD